jgi:hypothetical protein
MTAREDRSRAPASSAIGCALALALVGAAGLARAERPRARLIYARGAGAERCPDEAALARAVALRLGYDPFFDDAPRTIFARIGATRRALHGTLELRDETGALLGSHQLTLPDPACDELAAALELAIAIAIDPLSAARAAPPPQFGDGLRMSEPDEAELAPIVAPKKPSALVLPATARKTELHGDLGLHATVGSAPVPSWGLALGLGLRWGSWALGFQLRGDLPVTQESAGGAIGSSVVMALALPCVHLGIFAGCGLLGGGILIGYGQRFVVDERQVLPWFVAGARAGLEIPLARRVALRLHADLVGHLVQAVLTIDHMEAWRSPPVSGAFGLAVVGALR